MLSKSTIQNVNLADLKLDLNNPRFAELYSGSDNEDDLIEYLLYTEAAEEVAKAIVKADEFYPDRPLWVLRDNGKFLVKDGNRRCSAVKALQLPGKYQLSLPKTTITQLPVLVYEKQADIDERIVEEHAGNLFRRWERIAKALEVLKLAEGGRWEDVRELDSKPGDLIKLASFYKEAVKFGGDDLRTLLRRGRGKTGGKTIIFERLFRDSMLCGYKFKSSPKFTIDVIDPKRFESYIIALVKYLKDAGENTTTETVDKNKEFIKLLIPFGFDIGAPKPQEPSNTATSKKIVQLPLPTPNSGEPTITQSPGTSSNPIASLNPTQQPPNLTPGPSKHPNVPIAKKGSIRKTPVLKRKSLPAGLKSRVDEYFSISPINEPNAKIAMARVTFECVLKYLVENTAYNGSTLLSKSGHFGPAFRKLYIDFTMLKTKFSELILNTGFRKAFIAFDLDDMHSIIHNYRVNAVSHNAEQISNNLVILIEFMLQDEVDLLASLDLSKL